ncbi:MAG: YceD family protein [Proteobacteria bacterium]|jgi:uncharacterized protein|nr:YceD family protein [Pseudomonadota bacterium]
MSGGQIPAYVDARKAFVQETELQGAVDLERLPRFAATLASDEADVAVSLRFAKADNGQRTISGHLRVATEVSCQRCLEPMPVAWEDDIALVLLEDESLATRLEPEWDPWVWTEPKLMLAELVEEQLLLSMPVVSYHTDQECADKLGYVPAADTGSEAPKAQKESPFAVLKALKKNDSND